MDAVLVDPNQENIYVVNNWTGPFEIGPRLCEEA